MRRHRCTPLSEEDEFIIRGERSFDLSRGVISVTPSGGSRNRTCEKVDQTA
jgi:hypothetical protein